MVFIDFEWMNASLNAKKKGIETKDATVAILLADEEIVDARHNLMEALGAAATALELLEVAGPPTSVRFVSEAWISKQTEMAPSKDPKKAEALIATGADDAGKVALVSKEIKRVSSYNKKKPKSDEPLTVKVELQDLPEMGGMDGYSSPLLEGFWKVRKQNYKAMKEDGKYVMFIEEAKNDPERILKTTMETAIKAARLHHLESQGKGGVSKM